MIHFYFTQSKLRKQLIFAKYLIKSRGDKSPLTPFDAHAGAYDLNDTISQFLSRRDECYKFVLLPVLSYFSAEPRQLNFLILDDIPHISLPLRRK